MSIRYGITLSERWDFTSALRLFCELHRVAGINEEIWENLGIAWVDFIGATGAPGELPLREDDAEGGDTPHIESYARLISEAGYTLRIDDELFHIMISKRRAPSFIVAHNAAERQLFITLDGFSDEERTRFIAHLSHLAVDQRVDYQELGHDPLDSALGE